MHTFIIIHILILKLPCPFIHIHITLTQVCSSITTTHLRCSERAGGVDTLLLCGWTGSGSSSCRRPTCSIIQHSDTLIVQAVIMNYSVDTCNRKLYDTPFLSTQNPNTRLFQTKAFPSVIVINILQVLSNPPVVKLHTIR